MLKMVVVVAAIVVVFFVGGVVAAELSDLSVVTTATVGELGVVSTGVANFNIGADAYDEPKRYPNYLLIIRYPKYNCLEITTIPTVYHYSTYSTYSIPSCWTYLYEAYNSLDEVVRRLQEYTGPGMSLDDKETDLVGLWELNGEKGNVIDKLLSVEEIKHKEKVEVRIEERTEIRWRKK